MTGFIAIIPSPMAATIPAPSAATAGIAIAKAPPSAPIPASAGAIPPTAAPINPYMPIASPPRAPSFTPTFFGPRLPIADIASWSSASFRRNSSSSRPKCGDSRSFPKATTSAASRSTCVVSCRTWPSVRFADVASCPSDADIVRLVATVASCDAARRLIPRFSCSRFV